MRKGIIVASFGTSYNDTRRLCIESIEERISARFKDYKVVRAFTSEKIIEKIKKRDNLQINNVPKALLKMKEDGLKEVFIQPLHILEGYEYNKVLKQVEIFKGEHKDILVTVGKPLLSSNQDFDLVTEAFTVKALSKDEALLLMGHGTSHQADNSYSRLEEKFRERHSPQTYIATIEGEKTLEDILPALKESGIKKVFLTPLMLVAGDHAINDMASDEEDSWRSILEGEGFEVNIELKGMGENNRIQDIFIDHLHGIVGD